MQEEIPPGAILTCNSSSTNDERLSIVLTLVLEGALLAIKKLRNRTTIAMIHPAKNAYGFARNVTSLQTTDAKTKMNIKPDFSSKYVSSSSPPFDEKASVTSKLFKVCCCCCCSDRL